MNRLWRIGWRSLYLALLVAMLLAWPLSYIPREWAGIGLENTPAYGWRFFYDGVTTFPGVSIAVGNGSCYGFRFSYATNPKPPVPAPGTTWYGVDLSRWHGNLHLGFGTILTGSMYSAHWQARTGFVFPLWPMSILAAIAIYFHTRRWMRERKRIKVSGCNMCGYDLRAHNPGDKCPECGTVVTSSPPAAAHPKAPPTH